MIRDVFENVLFVGNALDARDVPLLYRHEIRAVVDLAVNEAPAILPRDFIYCRFPLNDGGGNEPAILKLAIETIVSLVQNQTRTLVACSAGMSRAPSLAAAAIAKLTDQCSGSLRDPSRTAERSATLLDDCLAKIIAHAPNDVSPLLWAEVKSACGIG